MLTTHKLTAAVILPGLLALALACGPAELTREDGETAPVQSGAVATSPTVPSPVQPIAARPSAAEQPTAARPSAAEQPIAARPSAAEQPTAARPSAAEQPTAARPSAAEQPTPSRHPYDPPGATSTPPPAPVSLGASAPPRRFPTAVPHPEGLVGCLATDFSDPPKGPYYMDWCWSSLEEHIVATCSNFTTGEEQWACGKRETAKAKDRVLREGPTQCWAIHYNHQNLDDECMLQTFNALGAILRTR